MKAEKRKSREAEKQKQESIEPETQEKIQNLPQKKQKLIALLETIPSSYWGILWILWKLPMFHLRQRARGPLQSSQRAEVRWQAIRAQAHKVGQFLRPICQFGQENMGNK
jgi:hypothetical protein